jgi:hypothetical protein
MNRTRDIVTTSLMILFTVIISSVIFMSDTKKLCPAIFSIGTDCSLNQDTIIVNYSFTHFKFEVKSVIDQTYFEKKSFCTVKLNKNKQFLFCFESSYIFSEDSLIHFYDTYYGFSYNSGGNYSRSAGYELLKIAPDQDTAFQIGKIQGYKDINGDKTKEFYILDVIEFGEASAGNIIGEFEVKLVNDSLVYPFTMDGY